MYYFVCMRCDAKFFSQGNSESCPRCGAGLTSTDEQTPPWNCYASKKALNHDKALSPAEDQARGEPQVREETLEDE